MLSENDVHYIAGLLYAATGASVEQVTLGDRIFDEASETKRDVDIVVLTAGDTGIAGIEVKDEARALDVIVVEALCLKLADMPALSNRAIVSASGYTAPARRKAARHGVTCLTFVRGAVPPFDTIDLSRLQSVTVLNSMWVRGPHITFGPDLQLSAQDRESFDLTTTFTDVTGQVETSAGLVAQQVASAALNTWTDPRQLGPVRIDVRVNILNPVFVAIGSRQLEISTAQVEGIARRDSEIVPLTAACYMVDEVGRPFAAAAVVEAMSGLVAFAVSPTSNELLTIHLPDPLRRQRPIRYPLKRSSPSAERQVGRRRVAQTWPNSAAAPDAVPCAAMVGVSFDTASHLPCEARRG